MGNNTITPEQQAHLNMYLRNMQIIKYRLEAVHAILDHGLPHPFSLYNCLEFCVLQIRKILELIAYSSLASDANLYEQKLKDLEKMWKANLILKDIERIHSDFYPHPITIVQGEPIRWIDKADRYLSRKEFEKIYDKCGKYLHEASSFKSDADIENEYELVRQSLPSWVTLIEELLSTHYVWLYNEDAFLIILGSKDEQPTGKIYRKESKVLNGTHEI